MKHSLFLMILLLSLSCTSRSQAKRDSIIDTLSDSLSATDSISPTDTLRLLFVGDLMQHQGQSTLHEPQPAMITPPVLRTLKKK